MQSSRRARRRNSASTNPGTISATQCDCLRLYSTRPARSRPKDIRGSLRLGQSFPSVNQTSLYFLFATRIDVLSLSSAMSSSSADVIVIGAGLSGLQAAFSIQAAGYSVIILEARDLVGGKLWSTPRADGKGIQELGAAWINDSNQSHVWSYCQQFNLTPVIQNIKGSVACQDAQGNCHFFPFGELPNVSLHAALSEIATHPT